MRLKLVLLFLLAACGKQTPPQDGKPTVLVSVPPYVYFVEQIAQGAVHIETLIPAGANPHIYESTPQEAERHQQASLWIYLGEPFDKKILPFFRDGHHPIRIVDVAQGIPLLSTCENHCSHHHHDSEDLHIWLSPVLAKQQAQTIAKALIGLMPEKEDAFLANLARFLDELDQLNARLCALLSPFQGRSILVSHPAFAYFCKEYHLVQLSIEVEGKDPLPRDVTNMLNEARRTHVQSVLIEPQYSNKGAELVAGELHLPTHCVDPYAENYAENLLRIGEVIAQ